MTTEADRQCARDLLAGFAHTQPPADFMLEQCANHIAAHRERESAALSERIQNLAEEHLFLTSMMAAFQWQRIDGMSEEEVRKELLDEGYTDERINAGIEKCRAMARLALEKKNA